jgi:tetratricopeptide (TPR) repeat protein
LLQQATRAMNDGAPEPALAILNRLVGAQPDFAEAWNKRATLHFLMGNYEASLADIDKVLDLEPRHFGALSGRGMIYQRQKKYGAALAAFNDALAINPNMPSVKDAVQALEKLEQRI